ncbi:ABC transporter substrate-binding protein [Streptomyces sp. NPDC050560]|uniref:ABC transporter substrate-binding protein n=1 Tax=Streptomyces sp. NPDC050560 TaxID=3365630 RepID=UPI00379E3603
MNIRTRGRYAAVAAAALAALTACTNSDAGGPAPATSGGTSVTVKGKLGTATVKGRPRTVVALDFTSADIATQLGFQPVAMSDVPLGPKDGIQPWTEAALHGDKPALLSTADGDPVDKVASYHPDVILATKDYNLTKSYPQLSAIAPVVHYTDAPNTDSWQQTTRTVAKALGVPGKGEKLISGAESAIAKARKDHPAVVGRKFNFLVSPEPSGVWAVNSTKDVSAQFLSRLGLTLDEPLRKLPTSSIPGRTRLSYERISDTDTDILFATGSAASLRTLGGQQGFKALAAVREHRYLTLDPTIAQAIAFPSATSITWAVDKLMPRIDKAAKRG